MPSVYLGDFPEPDRIEGAPHPRETPRLYGHAGAEAEFLSAFNAGRLHHAWLIAGPRGVGKATLAWRIARFLLTAPEGDGGLFGAPPPPDTLDVPEDDPAARRIAALSEPRLFLLRRGLNESEKAPAQEILVKEVRALKSHFALSSADGGRRVAIIDAADDLNPSAANALLKLLEEPPVGVTFLLIAHQPNRLLPTIRSRCRLLRLAPLAPDDLSAALAQAGAEVPPGAEQALAELAGGSVGAALRLVNLDGLRLYGQVAALFDTLPRMDRTRALDLAEAGAARGAEARFDLTLTLIDLFLARLARAGSLRQTPPEAAPNEAAILARLAPTPAAARGWADLAQGLTLRVRRGRAVNLDPAALLMDMVLKIDETAGTLAQR
ncbi:DNA polymerase III subunit delta' [Ruixingdingia sedimenti]|uniref:DNA polymerase III subunit delta n=1 Tax=Ruixingdingia sedimenti TaxID=3073604 RepID=A0ABU1FCP8_9RHOB|nr:DNA polymerase III subunit delta' [Xinfangfangia sp. LG-4]MDR5654622.1 DNA polymerase III subunit delta' [Xinfangfangia sp. LG-4]